MSAPNKHTHHEAFAIMQYACKACGHYEKIWNSRDGVTPFCMLCPSCGEGSLYHVNFKQDIYAPDHKPHVGQRMWIDLTPERAAFYAQQQIKSAKEQGYEMTVTVDKLVASMFSHSGPGEAPPDLDIFGYRRITE